MHLDDGNVEADRFNLHANELQMLQLLKQAIQHPGLGPAVHAGIDRVPVAEALGQRVPFTDVLGDLQDRVDYVEVAERDVAALYRQERLDATELSGADFHAAQYII